MKTIAIWLLLGTAVLFAADKPPVPTLDKDKTIEIRELQVKLQNNIIQLQNLEKQYRDIQDKNNDLIVKLNGFISSAQDSVDKEKKSWVLNTDTLKFEAPAKK